MIKLPALMVQDKRGIHYNKKGISPLIATILLVAFVIVIAILIWFWWNNVIREQAQKIGQESTGQWICANDVEAEISNPSCADVTGEDGNYTIRFEADNYGSYGIDYFKARFDGNDGSMVVNTVKGLAQGQISSFDVKVDTKETGDLKTLEIIPVIKVNNIDSFCNEKSVNVVLTGMC